jgi:hypothetical protein
MKNLFIHAGSALVALCVSLVTLKGSVLDSTLPPTALIPEKEERVSIQAYFAWENRYVTEGIDNVPGSTFTFTEVTAAYNGLTAGIWYAQALRDIYNEVNAYGGYAFETGPLTWFGGVNYLWYPTAVDPDSWEIFLEVEWAVLPYLNLFALTYYDVDEVQGGFLEFGISSEIPLLEDRVILEPYFLFGVDYGFVSMPRRLQMNNAQVGLTVTVPMAWGIDAFATINHSFTMHNLSALGEGDVTWGGFGLTYTY